MAAHSTSKTRRLDTQDVITPSTGSVESPHKRFGPRSAVTPHFGEAQTERELRTYTEEQVARMLQVSRSQLRKWRMNWSRGLQEGPPFRKMGRMIRYPELGLRTYIYGP